MGSDWIKVFVGVDDKEGIDLAKTRMRLGQVIDGFQTIKDADENIIGWEYYYTKWFPIKFI